MSIRNLFYPNNQNIYAGSLNTALLNNGSSTVSTTNIVIFTLITEIDFVYQLDWELIGTCVDGSHTGLAVNQSVRYQVNAYPSPITVNFYDNNIFPSSPPGSVGISAIASGTNAIFSINADTTPGNVWNWIWYLKILSV